MWGNYRALGYRRMIYTNTVSVRVSVIDEPTAAMGDSPGVTAALWHDEDQADDDSAGERASR
jgi:hypothetical protein